MLEHSLSSERGLRIFAHRSNRIRFQTTSLNHGAERVYIARRERNDTRLTESLSDAARQVRVHGPGKTLLTGGAEFSCGHEDHVRAVRKRFEDAWRQEV